MKSHDHPVFFSESAFPLAAGGPARSGYAVMVFTPEVNANLMRVQHQVRIARNPPASHTQHGRGALLCRRASP